LDQRWNCELEALQGPTLHESHPRHSSNTSTLKEEEQHNELVLSVSKQLHFHNDGFGVYECVWSMTSPSLAYWSRIPTVYTVYC